MFRHAPRRRWLRRMALTVALALALPWVWAGWNLYRYGNDLEAAIAEADRLDPGWRLEELEAKRDAPPDAENAALRVMSLAQKFPTGQEGQNAVMRFGNILDDAPPPARLHETQLAAIRDALAAVG